jgi:hypothetical protein
MCQSLETEIDQLESYIHQELKDVKTTYEIQFIIEKVSRHEYLIVSRVSVMQRDVKD